MKSIARFIALPVIMAALGLTLHAQMTPDPKTDVSDKALITKATPPISPLTNKSAAADIAALRKMADDYYTWRNENYPVGSSDSGLHTWDDRLTDYSAGKDRGTRTARPQVTRSSSRTPGPQLAEG